MKALAVNLVIAIVWLLLSGEPSAASFVVGFLVGFILLGVFGPVIGGGDYARRGLAFVRFVVRFAGAFLVANLKVASTILFRRRDSLHPGFVPYDVAGLSRFEILLLAYCVSLTPGSTMVDLSDDRTVLTFHALEAADPVRIRDGIDRTLRRWILAFTR